MRLRRARRRDTPGLTLTVWTENGWIPLAPALERYKQAGHAVSSELAAASDDVIAFLAGGHHVHPQTQNVLAWAQEADIDWSQTFDPAPMLPFEPRSFRDYSLWEKHMIDAARGIVRRFMPQMRGILTLYESITARPFPKLKPKPMFYQVPVYYMGNHLNFYGDGESIPWPPYSRALDYELELGVVIVRSGRNLTPEEGEAAIGGFVVLNDFSARDMQAREFAEGVFGPVVKAKNFANALGPDVVTADEVLPRFEALRGTVRVNGEVWGEGTTANPTHGLGDMVAYASWGETLYPGELLGTGTFPGCSGVEVGRWLQPGDEVELHIEGIGKLKNRVGEPEEDRLRALG